MNTSVLHHIPIQSLMSLTTALKNSAPNTISKRTLQQIVGPHLNHIEALIQSLWHEGMTSPQIAIVFEAVLQARLQLAPSNQLFDLVLSGPTIAGIPTRDTAAIFNELLYQAQKQVLIVGYAFYAGRVLFEPLAQRMIAQPELEIIICLNLHRPNHDNDDTETIRRRFVTDFYAQHWPWEQKPIMYYDARALADHSRERASLHAKCVIVDQKRALITSANFTEAAQSRNIEAGVIINHDLTVQRLAAYFEGLIQSNILSRLN